MDALYLIVHKVRGEPAIDVAHRVVIGDEDVCLIPTSGHRAYPYKYRALHHNFDLEHSAPRSEEWDALPDHYSPAKREGSKARLRTRLREIWRTRRVREKVLRSA